MENLDKVDNHSAVIFAQIFVVFRFGISKEHVNELQIPVDIPRVVILLVGFILAIVVGNSDYLTRADGPYR